MDYEVNQLFQGPASDDSQELFREVLDSLAGIRESRIETFFNDKAVGARSKSLASSVRALVTSDLELKGWILDWAPFGGNPSYRAAMWKFDAAKKVLWKGAPSWITVELSFDNRIAVGTHLVKARVANSPGFRSEPNPEPILHHCIIAATKGFKESAGLDNSVATAEEYALASHPFKELDAVGTSLISIKALETIEVSQRKFGGRTKSKLLRLSPSLDT